MEDSDIKDEQKFRIKKIIKEKVNSEMLEQFEEQLKAQQRNKGKEIHIYFKDKQNKRICN
jgi:hypothetical protein